jgi:hypothetical protein
MNNNGIDELSDDTQKKELVVLYFFDEPDS